MRTSRLSRDTAALVTALSPRRRWPTRGAAMARSTMESEASSSSESSDQASEFEEKEGIETAGKAKRKRSSGGATAGATDSSNAPAGKKLKRAPAKRVVRADGTVEVQAPLGWEEMYATAAALRKTRLAPVDTMGCERLADEAVSERDQRFQTLIALMLSSQTKDTVNAVAMRKLRENLPGGFNLEAILVVPSETLNELIWQVGFHNTKTKHIKQAALILRDRYKSDIPDTIEGLVSLPGVGPKMAYLAMSAAWGRDEGIGVDVHVHRITNLWKWHKTKTPEETRAALESWLPRERWHDINTLLVGFGQTWCPPVGRKCGECGLAQKGICPSAVVNKADKIKWANREVKVEVENGEVVIKDEAGAEGTEVKLEELDNSALRSDLARDIEDVISTSKSTRRKVR